jgi:hypothetical protein
VREAPRRGQGHQPAPHPRADDLDARRDLRPAQGHHRRPAHQPQGRAHGELGARRVQRPCQGADVPARRGRTLLDQGLGGARREVLDPVRDLALRRHAAQPADALDVDEHRHPRPHGPAPLEPYPRLVLLRRTRRAAPPPAIEDGMQSARNYGGAFVLGSTRSPRCASAMATTDRPS